ncbi:hypothetical protein [Arthrobacter sp. fls2-241-R2A-200]|uniref:hypothetical protein n=1 Tax=Arthrobacter sp. fls2-241-R2A-200 TaxID=3040281 RepID=UPI00254B9ECC|nr:hypothetical protein [Arthrobacter sp. fls2-241-R2A-200]
MSEKLNILGENVTEPGHEKIGGFGPEGRGSDQTYTGTVGLGNAPVATESQAPGPAKSQHFDASALIPSALLGVIAYAALYVVACAFLVLAIVGLAISQGGNTNVPASSMLPQGSTPSP